MMYLYAVNLLSRKLRRNIRRFIYYQDLWQLLSISLISSYSADTPFITTEILHGTYWRLKGNCELWSLHFRYVMWGQDSIVTPLRGVAGRDRREGGDQKVIDCIIRHQISSQPPCCRTVKITEADEVWIVRLNFYIWPEEYHPLIISI